MAIRSKKAIGGYFELEIGPAGTHYHADALRFSSGRGALSYILKLARPSTVYLPFYICSVVLEPILLLGIEYKYIAIDKDFKLSMLPDLMDGEMLIYNDYFGLMGAYIEELEGRYGSKLIVDSTQSFFRRRVGDAWSFNSARKFFGVPDGAYVYLPAFVGHSSYDNYPRNDKFIYDHLILRTSGEPESGYAAYKRNELNIDTSIMKMSYMTERILENVNYKTVIAQRIENYKYLSGRLTDSNLLVLAPSKDDVPYHYPYLPSSGVGHEVFIRNRIYITKLWLEMPTSRGSIYDFERSLASNLLPLPVDHRYGKADMDRIIEIIEEFDNVEI